MCNDECPESAPVVDKYNICRACADVDENRPFWDGFDCLPCSSALGGNYFDDTKCVKECPNGHVAVEGSQICKPCVEISEETPLWSSGVCVACPAGWYFAKSTCAETCPDGYLKPVSGSICVEACGEYQISDGTQCTCAQGLQLDSRRCVPPSGTTWADFQIACAAAGKVVSLDGLRCDVQCGYNEKAVGGRCACKSSALLSWSRGYCVTRSLCPRIYRSDSGFEGCMNTDTCGEYLFLDTDG